MVDMIRCDYCDRIEIVTDESLNAKIPYYDELADKVEFEDSCSDCTREYREFKLAQRNRKEKSITE